MTLSHRCLSPIKAANHQDRLDLISLNPFSIFFKPQQLFFAIIYFVKKTSRITIPFLFTKSLPVRKFYWLHSSKQARKMQTGFIATSGARTRRKHKRGADFRGGDIAPPDCIISPNQVRETYTIQGIQLLCCLSPRFSFSMDLSNKSGITSFFHTAPNFGGVALRYTPKKG